jgi:transcription antitermination factor NusA-like protein
MGAMKDYVMGLEEQVWDEVVDVIAESDDIAEALEQGMYIAKNFDLDIHLGKQYITDTIHVMWNDFWSAQE